MLLLSCPAAPVACAVSGIEHSTHTLENLQSKASPSDLFSLGYVFLQQLCLLSTLVWALQLRDCCWWQRGGEGTAAERALCLVQHFSLQGTCAPPSSVPCRLAVMSFEVSLCAELTQGCL